MKKEREENRRLLEALYEEGEQVKLPQNLSAESMKGRLEQRAWERKKRRRRAHRIEAAATAACLFLAAGILFRIYGDSILMPERAEDRILEGSSQSVQDVGKAGFQKMQLAAESYEKIYEAMEGSWPELRYQGDFREYAIQKEAAKAEDAVFESEAAEESYGTTNLRTEGVEEADIVKNDGRYLYQIVKGKERQNEEEYIQILDTRDGLKEAARVEGFSSIEEFFVWEDRLIVAENKYLSPIEPLGRADYKLAYDEVLRFENQYHEISFYDISVREKPRKLKTFTLDGAYLTARISDGYFYGISRFLAGPGTGESDYNAYIPKADGIRFSAEQICLPEGTRGTSYLVLVSVDLKNPVSFADKRAVVSDGSLFYVSNRYIYAMEHQMPMDREGQFTDETRLLKFSYEKGGFFLRARGSVPGRLKNSFSLDEYQGKLRAVSTVQQYEGKKITDDRTSRVLGYDYEYKTRDNALYVLDEKLKQVGAVEHLAEEEEIRSARFLKDMAYFVTFRQTDPLFAVDLSSPAKPKILSEVKLSGFSEYLHAYGPDQLLGIGMEADEETGRERGMKLSMFDISNPAELKEEARCRLPDYQYSEALHEYRAVLISPKENIIGFSAEGSNRGKYWQHYLVYAYENGSFKEKLNLDIKNASGEYYRVRGTFIGDTFYLLRQDGSVAGYDRNTGQKSQEYTPEE